ncbi:hypothetical protein EDD11_002515 [Mortierella claussenii]|nr:hypothetical protein EDD11_002515 [Mortierella claussenii]
MSSATRVSLTSRPKDLAMFIYFVAHIPTTAFMDVVPLYPNFVRPYVQPLIQFAHRTLIWFNTFLHMEALVQLPFFFYAAWALYHHKKSVSLWICIYAAHVITTVLPCLTTLNLGAAKDFPFHITDSQKLFLTCLYSPWLLFPFWMLYECFQRVRSNEQSGVAISNKKHQ